MLLRVIAALMFAAAGTVGGFAKAEGLKSNLEFCRETGELLRMSAIFIRFQGLNVYELSSRLRSSSDLKMLTFLNGLPESFSQGENFHEQWKKAVCSQENIPNDERGILLSFGEIIGTSDIDGQMMSIKAIESELSGLESKRKEDFIRKSRLYRSAGALFGVMAGILII